MDKRVISNNRKAFHDYIICEKYVAGIVLTGTEIKSIRANGINLKDSFGKIENGETSKCSRGSMGTSRRYCEQRNGNGRRN